MSISVVKARVGNAAAEGDPQPSLHAVATAISQTSPPGGNLVAYAYAGGKPVSVTLNGQPLLSGITHEPHAPLSF